MTRAAGWLSGARCCWLRHSPEPVSELDDDDDVDGTVAVLALPIPVLALGMLVDALEVAYGKELRVRGAGDTLVVFRA